MSLAWEAFGLSNGAQSLLQMRERIEQYRRKASGRHEDYTIGCIILSQPFFLPKDRWIPVPTDFSKNLVEGKGYDLTQEPGKLLLRQVQEALAGRPTHAKGGKDLPGIVMEPPQRYGTPTMVAPRLGQGAFRIVVTDTYQRRYAVTGERVLPVLEAAHIRPYAEGGEHVLQNGLLLKRDIHALLDKGYVTVTTDYRFEVSRSIKEEFDNGKTHYALHGNHIGVPEDSFRRPSRENLIWHNEQVFRG